MIDIGPGDWVECVDARPGAASGRQHLVHGALYRVEKIRPWTPNKGCSLDACGDLCVVVEGAGGAGMCPNRFRPIYRPKASVIEALKQPVPLERVDEPVARYVHLMHPHSVFWR